MSKLPCGHPYVLRLVCGEVGSDERAVADNLHRPPYWCCGKLLAYRMLNGRVDVPILSRGVSNIRS
jgi:hypothetical protein